MTKKKLAKSSIYSFKNLSKHNNISHFITTRQWGNLALHVNDDPNKVLKNRRNLVSIFTNKKGGPIACHSGLLAPRSSTRQNEVGSRISINNFVFANQVHGNNIAIITDKQKGKGSITQEDAIKLTDGLITSQKNICLTILVADCVPILMFDPVKKAVGAIHAGRKGTQLKIAKQAVKAFTKNFNSNPKDLIVGFGPSIGPCCYEFFQLPTPGVEARKNKKGNWSIDLWEKNKKQLIESGVLEKNIEVSAICTSCNKDKFFSARGDGETGSSSQKVKQSRIQTGRLGVGIILNSSTNCDRI